MGEGVTQDELDRLFTATLETAHALLAQRGAFFPVLFELRPDRTIHSLAVLDQADHGERDDLVRGYLDLFRTRAAQGAILACAIGRFAAGEPGEPGGAIMVAVRAAGHASDLTVPVAIGSSGFLRKGRRVTLGEVRGQAVANEVFGGV